MKRSYRQLALGMLLFIGYIATGSANLVYLGPVDAGGTGLGAVNTILTVQRTPDQSGCVAWNGSADVIGPAACPPGIAGGDEKGGGSQTLTRTIAQLGLLDAASIRIAMNANEPGALGLTTNQLVLRIYDATTGAVLFSGSLAAPVVFPTSFSGTGNSGFAFALDAAQAAAAQAAFGNPANRLGLSTQQTNTTGGAGTFYIFNVLTARLGMVKTVSGGTALSTAFTLTATGDPTTGPTLVTGTTPVAPVVVPVGVYTLTETGPLGYTSTGFTCAGGGTLVGNRLTITSADAGAIITCTIANTFTPLAAAQLGLVKTVSGGTALSTAFTLTATGDPSTGPTLVTGTTPVAPVNVPVGVYTLTETGPLGYTSTGFTCAGGGTLVGNRLTITSADAGAIITCTIANTFTPLAAAQLALVKTVSGGTALSTAFTLTATGDRSTGPTLVVGTTPVAPVNVPVGVYTLTETGPLGYTSTGFTCAGGGTLVGNRLTITSADAGRTITCTIVNTFAPLAAAQLGLVKTVSGGTALSTAFTLTATGDPSTGPTLVVGTTPVAPVNVPVGVYTLTETGPLGYTSTGFTCAGGGAVVGNRLTITSADAGRTITCTIANVFTPLAAAQLGLVKTVSGGGALNTAFTLTATGDPSTGPTVVTGTTPVAPVNVPVGVYTLTETGPPGYASTGFTCAGGGTLVGNTLTISSADAGRTITCTIANAFSAAATPTLSEWATIMLAGLMALFGFIAMRRQGYRIDR